MEQIKHQASQTPDPNTGCFSTLDLPCLPTQALPTLMKRLLGARCHVAVVTANLDETLTHADVCDGEGPPITQTHKEVHGSPGGNCPQPETIQIPQTPLSSKVHEP